MLCISLTASFTRVMRIVLEIKLSLSLVPASRTCIHTRRQILDLHNILSRLCALPCLLPSTSSRCFRFQRIHCLFPTLSVCSDFCISSQLFVSNASNSRSPSLGSMYISSTTFFIYHVFVFILHAQDTDCMTYSQNMYHRVLCSLSTEFTYLFYLCLG